jgi:glycosyltransferase involved in cell wall biosynthesis
MPIKGQRTPLDASWRTRAQLAQEAVLPAGSVVVSCWAPLGVGGLGRHLQEIIDALARRGQTAAWIGESASEGAPVRRRGLHTPLTALIPVARFSPAWRMWMASVAFDREAARRLPPADHLIAFNGTAVSQFRAARAASFETLSLVSATSHFRHVLTQHERAHRQYPLERPWASHLLRRNLREYAQADRIYVSTTYALESFIAEGFGKERLSVFPLTPDPRFTPGRGEDSPGARATSSTYDVVYAGGLTIDKGVPLLVDAIRRLPHSDLRLVLVGGWTTRGMRRFMQSACAQDGRLSVRVGDPLPHLRAASLCVHPSYSDGFGYAPAEALACGVPVIVSEDTGMKELLDGTGCGLVVPTGDAAALGEAIDAAYRGELT